MRCFVRTRLGQAWGVYWWELPHWLGIGWFFVQPTGERNSHFLLRRQGSQKLWWPSNWRQVLVHEEMTDADSRNGETFVFRRLWFLTAKFWQGIWAWYGSCSSWEVQGVVAGTVWGVFLFQLSAFVSLACPMWVDAGRWLMWSSFCLLSKAGALSPWTLKKQRELRCLIWCFTGAQCLSGSVTSAQQQKYAQRLIWSNNYINVALQRLADQDDGYPHCSYEWILSISEVIDLDLGTLTGCME